MKKTIRYIIREAKKQKIKVELVDTVTQTFELTKGNKKIYISKGNYGWNPGPSEKICEEKMLTNRLLEKVGLNVSNGDVLFDAKKIKKSWFLNKYNFPFIIKKHDGSQGKNFYKIDNKDDFYKVFDSLKRRNIQFVAEDFVKGNEYRFLAIKGKTVAVVNRIPAHIIGNDKNTIEDLIDIKNDKTLKKEEKYDKQNSLVRIKIDRTVKNFLKNNKLSLDFVPKKNQIVYLRSNSNVSSGGTSIDYTDKYHKNYAEIITKVFKAIGRLKIVGIDIITQNVKDDPYKVGYKIIEINSQPGIDIHEFPGVGKRRNVSKKIVDAMFEN